MKNNYIKIVLGVTLLGLFGWLAISETADTDVALEDSTMRTSGAGHALDMWFYERAYPNASISSEKLMNAFNLIRENTKDTDVRSGSGWESLGPINIGGRMLCMAFHPTDEDIIYAGSASGGLWKSTTQGLGQNAWEYVSTGFPVLGVGAIAIDQNNPDIIFIGTGETYGVGIAEPGTINRLTRGTYGIGILKSTDGGASWTQVLAFEEDEIKGVQDIEISNQSSLEMYAATTDGLYQSLDGGDNWALIFNELNCTDVEVDPNDGNILYVAQGNFNYGLDPNLSGLFKSTNKGGNFTELLDTGLLTAWSGSAKLTFDPTNSNTIYADIQVGWFNTGPTTPAGIFKSTNGGTNWTNINNQNIVQYQGWYSHDLAINPLNNSEMINVGLQAWKSTDTGVNFTQQSQNSWTLGEVPVEFPEGQDTYVHSDVHAVYYHPINNKVFFATDGGIFVSDDGEVPFTTLNGGLQTTQFYADMASHSTDLNLIIAGAQDNATYVYRGNPAWWRVIGGDGMTASIARYNSDIMYGSWQGLNIMKSVNNGFNYINIRPTLVTGDYTAFSAPFELAPTDNSLIYAGATYLYRSDDAGANWNTTSNQAVDGGNVLLKIAIAHDDPNLLYVSTAGDPLGGFGSNPKVFRSVDGGANFTQMIGLPDRILKDVEFDPNDSATAYLTYSGFGTDHVFKTTNNGNNWTAIDNGLPDLPTNTILIDPLSSGDLYVGNDLGVYYSDNGGNSWSPYSEDLPEAAMVYDLNMVGIPNRKLRIATHGHGIYQRNFVSDPLAINDFDALNDFVLYPNPASEKVNISGNNVEIEKIRVFSLDGQLQISLLEMSAINVSHLSPGIYLVAISTSDGNSAVKKLIVK